MELGYNGNDGVLRGNFTCRVAGWYDILWVRVWSGE